MDKNCCNFDLFIRIFRLLLTIFILVIDSLKKLKRDQLLYQVIRNMNDMINKLALVQDRFTPEIHLNQTGFTYSVCGPFLKHKERIKIFQETRDSRYIYENELAKASFQHDMAYNTYKVLQDEAFEIANNPKYDGYQRGFYSMVYNLFDKKSSGKGINSG